MEIFGYLAAALIGISLGLIGGGGSILTVPVLVYLFGIDPSQATSYSLFIVGISSAAGVFPRYRKGLVSVRTAMLFGVSSITTVLLVRKFFLPLIPDPIASFGNIVITRSLLTMVLFAVLMLLASFSMIRSGKGQVKEVMPQGNSFLKLSLYGIGIGIVTGLLGAGGGFLIIPALVLLLGLDMKVAIGTSLLIIAMNSLAGFAGEMTDPGIDWRLLLTLAVIAVAGLFAGTYMGRSIPGSKLKKGFGWFVLAMGLFIIVKELTVM